jgi:hypothetical protein
VTDAAGVLAVALAPQEDCAACRPPSGSVPSKSERHACPRSPYCCVPPGHTGGGRRPPAGSGRLPCHRSPRMRGDARVGQTNVLKQLDVIRALEIGLQDRAPGCSWPPAHCSATTWPSARPGGDLFSPTPDCPGCTRPWPGCPEPETSPRVHRHRRRGPLGHPGRWAANHRPARPRCVPARPRHRGRPAVRRTPQGLGPRRPTTRSTEDADPPRRAPVAT